MSKNGNKWCGGISIFVVTYAYYITLQNKI